MKKLLVLLTVSGMLFASSCTKCTSCTKSNAPDVRYCEKDFANKALYGAAIDGAENNGYNCNKSI